MKKFFWMCAGVDIETLKEAKTDHVKYTIIGTAIFVTAILAALSGGYAFYTLFRGTTYALELSILFGLFWGFIIFNFDRMIASGITKKGNSWKDKLQEFGFSSPRILLALILGIVISRPLELYLFKKDIRAQIKKDYQAEANNFIENDLNYLLDDVEDLDSTIRVLEAEKTSKDKKANRLQKEWDDERFGNKTSSTSGVGGYGPNAKKKEQEWRRVQGEYEEIKEQIKRLIQKRDSLKAEIELIRTSIAETTEEEYSFLRELTALESLSDNNPHAANSVFFITLVFILLELSPAVVKILMPYGNYDELLEKKKGYERDSVDNQIRKGYDETFKNLQSELEEKIRVNEAKINYTRETEKEKIKLNKELEKEKLLSEMELEELKNTKMRELKLKEKLQDETLKALAEIGEAQILNYKRKKTQEYDELEENFDPPEPKSERERDKASVSLNQQQLKNSPTNYNSKNGARYSPNGGT